MKNDSHKRINIIAINKETDNISKILLSIVKTFKEYNCSNLIFINKHTNNYKNRLSLEDHQIILKSYIFVWRQLDHVIHNNQKIDEKNNYKHINNNLINKIKKIDSNIFHFTNWQPYGCRYPDINIYLYDYVIEDINCLFKKGSSLLLLNEKQLSSKNITFFKKESNNICFIAKINKSDNEKDNNNINIELIKKNWIKYSDNNHHYINKYKLISYFIAENEEDVVNFINYIEFYTKMHSVLIYNKTISIINKEHYFNMPWAWDILPIYINFDEEIISQEIREKLYNIININIEIKRLFYYRFYKKTVNDLKVKTLNNYSEEEFE